jgi:isoleucyl-tRNA synthetase
VQKVIKASKSGDWFVDTSGQVTCAGVELRPGEYTLETVVADGADATSAMLPGGGFILLNTRITPELSAEGLARDVIRVVQQARRDAGLDVSDRISLSIAATPAAQAAVRVHQQLIGNETLATAFELLPPDALDHDASAGAPAQVGDNETIRVRISS